MSDRATRSWLTSYRAPLVIPVASGTIPDGAVLVEGDRIAWVGPAWDHPPAPNARIVELPGAVITPGLVNAHTHLDLTVLRGLLDGLSFFEWIRAVVTARSLLTAEEWLDSARLGAIESLEAGITTIGDTAPTSASFDAMRELGLRGTAYIETFGPDPAQSRGALADLSARIADYRERATPLVQLGVSPHAPYSVSDDLYTASVAWAREHKLPIATHVAESEAESDLVAGAAGPFADMLRGRGLSVEVRARTPIALLDRLGVLGDDALLIHCVRCDDADIAAIAKARSSVVTCPMSNRYFGHGSAPWAKLRREVGRVASGTDSMASNSGMDILQETRESLEVPPDRTGADVWTFATLVGATALGLANEIGSIAVGKQADLAAFPIPPGMATTSDIRIGPRAALTVIAGVERVREGRIIGEADAIRSRVRASAARLRQWRSEATPG